MKFWKEKYIRADKLQKAIHNFLRNKDKADMYREIAEIYKSLGDYKTLLLSTRLDLKRQLNTMNLPKTKRKFFLQFLLRKRIKKITM